MRTILPPAGVLLAALALWFAALPAAHAAEVCGLNPRGDNYLSLRTGPGTQHREMLRLAPGTWLDIEDVSGAWFKVVANGSFVGWVHSRYVCQ